MSQPQVSVRGSSVHGLGVFADEAIPAGAVVLEYTGERVSRDEALRRESATPGVTYIFRYDDDVLIDGAVGGNESRFINHSCDGNCEAVWDRRRIFIEARRNIKAGEELAYDYQYERMDDHTDEDERFYACRCGSSKCRGTILAPMKSDA